MPTITVAANTTDTTTLATIDTAAQLLPDGDARRALEAVTETLRSGRDIIIAGADDTVTPSQVAQVLGVSRAHLYKILDSGALPYTVVGARDRRISMADLRSYVAKAEELRRASAHSAAHSRTTLALSLDEM